MAAIVRDYGLVVITRHGSDAEKFIYESDLLTSYKVCCKNTHTLNFVVFLPVFGDSWAFV